MQALALAVLREVGIHRLDAHLAGGADALGRGGQRGGVARAEHHVAALGGEGLGAGKADAFRPAGDEHALALQLHVHRMSLPVRRGARTARAANAQTGAIRGAPSDHGPAVIRERKARPRPDQPPRRADQSTARRQGLQTRPARRLRDEKKRGSRSDPGAQSATAPRPSAPPGAPVHGAQAKQLSCLVQAGA